MNLANKLVSKQFLEKAQECQEVHHDLSCLDHARHKSDWSRFWQNSNQTPVIFYFWSPYNWTCRFVGPILDEAVLDTDGSVRLVGFELDQPKKPTELEELLEIERSKPPNFKRRIPENGKIPFAGVAHQAEWQLGYLISGWKGLGAEARIEFHPDQIPAGNFKDNLDLPGLSRASAAQPKERGMAAKVLRTTAAISTMGGSLVAEAAVKKAAKLAKGESAGATNHPADNDVPTLPADQDVVFYADLLGTKEGPEAVKAVVDFALSLVPGETASEIPSPEEPVSRVDVKSETRVPVDPLDQLKKLSELHDSGVVSDEEFEAKKADLLDKI